MVRLKLVLPADLQVYLWLINSDDRIFRNGDTVTSLFRNRVRSWFLAGKTLKASGGFFLIGISP